ncbi:DUF6282 family protein [Streptomyces acidicola]|uniref:DUF6282 family protein n=1 Tax=Streptomyces acidicola TaxID=2596892 RepID=UPI00343A18A3
MFDAAADLELDPRYDAVDDEEVTELLVGAVDLHVHPAPSPFPRRLGLLQAVWQAHAAGFRGLIVKSHHHSMVTDVLAVSDAVGALPIPVHSGVALNNQVGGINPSAVELALNLGGRIVWFPTISSDRHICVHNEELKFPRTAKPFRKDTPTAVLDGDGRVLPEVHDVLDLIRDADAILSGGHMGVGELDAVIRAAHAKGIEKIVVSHPNFVIGAEPELCREWSGLGVKFEHALCMYDDRSSFYHWELDVMLEYVKAVGVENTYIGSDLGQLGNPYPVQAYRRVVRGLLDLGVSHDDIRTMVSTNPGRMLGV